MQLRHASLRVGLFDTAARHVTTTRDDEVGETLLGVCGQSEVEITPWLRAIVGLRADPMRSRIDALNLATRQRLPSPRRAEATPDPSRSTLAPLPAFGVGKSW